MSTPIIEDFSTIEYFPAHIAQRIGIRLKPRTSRKYVVFGEAKFTPATSCGENRRCYYPTNQVLNVWSDVQASVSQHA